MISALPWHKVHFSFRLEACPQPELKKWLLFDYYFFMLNFDCTQWLLSYTLQSDPAQLCLSLGSRLCVTQSLQTLISDMPRGGF